LIKAIVPAYNKVLFPPLDNPTAETATSGETNQPKTGKHSKADQRLTTNYSQTA